MCCNGFLWEKFQQSMNGDASHVQNAALPKSKYMNCRPNGNAAYIPTEFEHRANIFTHGVFILPSIIGLGFLLEISHTLAQYLNALIYGLALISLFTMSTVWHSISYTGLFRNVKDFFHIGDRAVIYIFIAASYTPWLTLKPLAPNGGQCLYAVWLMALIGMMYQYLYHERYKWLETLFYVVIGCSPAVAWFSMIDRSGTLEMSIGGIIFLSGIYFFKSDGRIPCAHAIWHLFVVAGAACHYYAICQYLMVPIHYRH